MARRAGDVEAHAFLLCSLLLGFGFNAYVALGTVMVKKKGTGPAVAREYAWVMSFGFTQDGSQPRVVGYDPVSGKRAPYGSFCKSVLQCHRIDELINHETILANLQPFPAPHCSMDLEDARCWRRFPSKAVEDTAVVTALKQLSRPNEQFALRPSILDVTAAELYLEKSLRQRVTSHRTSLSPSLHTIWDDDLSYYLKPALSAYEADRVTGSSFGNDDFQDVIKRSVPDGHQFKGYPTCFSNINPEIIWSALEDSSNLVPADLLQTRGLEVRFALSTKITLYPEDVCATWIMLAVRVLPFPT